MKLKSRSFAYVCVGGARLLRLAVKVKHSFFVLLPQSKYMVRLTLLCERTE